MNLHTTLLYAIAFAWCAVLLAARIACADSLYYAFLAWNLFLACIPLGISFGLKFTRTWGTALPLLAAWLLFFPNAPYVLTDLLHVRLNNDIPQWFDLLLVLSFATVSLFLGFHSLRNVQDWISERLHRAAGWLAVVASLFLSGFGIYLGRFLRWNSWDIVGNPLGLAADIADRFLHPASHPRTWLVTIGFGTFLLLVYGFSLSLIRHAKRPVTPDRGAILRSAVARYRFWDAAPSPQESGSKESTRQAAQIPRSAIRTPKAPFAL